MRNTNIGDVGVTTTNKAVLLSVTACSSVDMCQPFGRTCYLHLQRKRAIGAKKNAVRYWESGKRLALWVDQQFWQWQKFSPKPYCQSGKPNGEISRNT